MFQQMKLACYNKTIVHCFNMFQQMKLACYNKINVLSIVYNICFGRYITILKLIPGVSLVFLISKQMIY